MLVYFLIMKELDRFSHYLSFLTLCLIVITISGCANQSSQGESESIRFHHSIVDSTIINNPWAKIPGDIDGDGALDIIIGGQKGPLVWYRNPDWKVFDITDGGYNTVDGECSDIDGDGDLDVVMGGLLWYENPGNLKNTPDRRWFAHPIADHPTHDIELADLDENGFMDVITRDQSDFGTMRGNTIHLWYNQGNNEWEEKVLECNHGEGLKVIDLDNDDDYDIVAAGFWFENVSGKWETHTFAKWHSSANLAVADFNNDRRRDIVLTPSELANNYFKISWFEQPKDLINEICDEHILIDSIECVIHGVGIGDFNSDGLADIAYSEMHQGNDPDEVVVLINENKENEWRKIILSNMGSHSIEIADIDGDGYDDIFGANWSGAYQPIELWLNKR